MKKSKLKKIATIIYDQVRNYEKVPSLSKEKVNYSDFDPEVSEKVKRLILNIIEYKDNIHITVGDDYFTVSTNDATKIKNNQGIKVNPYKISEDYYFEISVQQNEGFTLNYGYSKRSNFLDKSMFSELSPVIKQRLKEINAENFSEIWETLMRDSGIMRDNNLETLFDD
jgi:hypothetical protein